MQVQPSQLPPAVCVVKAKPDLTADEIRMLQACTIFQPPKLPTCAREAIHRLAQFAGVFIEGCTDPECEHRKLHDDYGKRWRTGTMILTAIQDIEAF